LRLLEPHAGAFVTAVPSSEDGYDTVMRPSISDGRGLTSRSPGCVSRLPLPALQAVF
jgi:hypothetical protein